jgi:hypothetical protein
MSSLGMQQASNFSNLKCEGKRERQREEGERGEREREKKGYKAKIRVSFQHTGLQEANYLQIITPGSFNISVVFSVY